MSVAVSMVLLAEIWEQVEHFIPTDERLTVAKVLVEMFRDNDAVGYANLEDNETLHTAIKEILSDEGTEDDLGDEDIFED